MSNYPDDIHNYDWHPNSPFYEEADDFDEEPEPEYEYYDDWEESHLCEWMW